MRLIRLMAILCLLAPACRQEKDLSNYRSGGVDDETGGETGGETSTESGTETGGDTSSVGSPASEGFAFCSGGGWVAGSDIHGVICTAPLDVASIASSNDVLTWQPGPITFIAP